MKAPSSYFPKISYLELEVSCGTLLSDPVADGHGDRDSQDQFLAETRDVFLGSFPNDPDGQLHGRAKVGNGMHH